MLILQKNLLEIMPVNRFGFNLKPMFLKLILKKHFLKGDCCFILFFPSDTLLGVFFDVHLVNYYAFELVS